MSPRPVSIFMTSATSNAAANCGANAGLLNGALPFLSGNNVCNVRSPGNTLVICPKNPSIPPWTNGMLTASQASSKINREGMLSRQSTTTSCPARISQAFSAVSMTSQARTATSLLISLSAAFVAVALCCIRVCSVQNICRLRLLFENTSPSTNVSFPIPNRARDMITCPPIPPQPTMHTVFCQICRNSSSVNAPRFF